MYLGSDAIALAPFTDMISYREDGDWVVLTRKRADVREVGTNLTGWPKSPRALAGRLRRAQTFLRTVGIEIAFGRDRAAIRPARLACVLPNVRDLSGRLLRLLQIMLRR
jgi:hypothetical protein